MFSMKEAKSGEAPPPVTIVQQGSAPMTLVPVVSFQTGRPIQICAVSNSNNRNRPPVPILPRPLMNLETGGQLTNQAPLPMANVSDSNNTTVDRPSREVIESPPELDRIDSQNGERELSPPITERVEEDFHDMLQRSVNEENDRYHNEKSTFKKEVLFIEIDGHRIEEYDTGDLEDQINEEHVFRKMLEAKNRTEEAGKTESTQAKVERSTTPKKRRFKKHEKTEKESVIGNKVTALLEEASAQMDLEDNKKRGGRKRRKTQDPEEDEKEEDADDKDFAPKIPKKQPPMKTKKYQRKNAVSGSPAPKEEKEEEKEGNVSNASPEENAIETPTPEKTTKKGRKTRTSEIDKLLGMDFGPKEGGTLKDLEEGKNGRLSLTPRRASLPERRLVSPSTGNRRERSTRQAERRSSRRQLASPSYNFSSETDQKSEEDEEEEEEEEEEHVDQVEEHEPEREEEQPVEEPKEVPKEEHKVDDKEEEEEEDTVDEKEEEEEEESEQPNEEEQIVEAEEPREQEAVPVAQPAKRADQRRRNRPAQEYNNVQVVSVLPRPVVRAITPGGEDEDDDYEPELAAVLAEIDEPQPEREEEAVRARVEQVQQRQAEVVAVEARPRGVFLPDGATLEYTRWTIEQLAQWVAHFTNSEATAQLFRAEEMDGSTLEYVTLDEIRAQVKIPFGSLLKLKTAFANLKTEYENHIRDQAQ